MCVRDRLLFQDEPWNFLMQNWIKTWIPSRRLLGFAGGLGSIDLIQVQSETWALCPLQLRTLRIWGDLLLFLTPLLKPNPLFPGCVFLFFKKKTTQKLITTKLLDSSNFNIDILVSFIVRWLWKQGQWKIDASFLPRGRTPTTFALSLCFVLLDLICLSVCSTRQRSILWISIVWVRPIGAQIMKIAGKGGFACCNFNGICVLKLERSPPHRPRRGAGASGCALY